MSGTGRSALAIAVLLPDVLGTYSDAGNAVVLAERARRRSITAQVQAVGIADPPPRTADVYLLGGGEDTAQLTAARWLQRHRMRDELAERHVVLAVCAGLQLLGTTMTDWSGHTYDGAGVLDISTAPVARRAVGEVLATATEPAIGRLTGFENHQGRTTLGPSAQSGPDALDRPSGMGHPVADAALHAGPGCSSPHTPNYALPKGWSPICAAHGNAPPDGAGSPRPGSAAGFGTSARPPRSRPAHRNLADPARPPARIP